MKSYYYLLYLFAILIFVSCNDIGSDEYETNTHHYDDVHKRLKGTAYLLAESFNELNEINIIHSSIQRSILFGLDENLRFNEILDNKASKIIGDDLKRKLLNSNSITKLGINLKSTNSQDLRSFLLENDLQIYWPYSEYWDGVTLPVITFIPEDITAGSNMGFKAIFEGGVFIGIDTIIVDEQFAIENPVWIINRNNLPYCELPDFSQGQFSHNKVAFSQKDYDLNLKSISESNMDISDKTFRVQIGWIKCTYQWDALWNGGPEFVSQWIGLGENDFNLDYMDKIYTHLTRDDVSKGRWIREYQTTNNEWLPEELNNYFVFYEEDNTWPRENLKGELTVKEGVTIKYDLPFGNLNEILKATVWSRNAFYNETRGIYDPNASFRDGWKLFSNNNTWWTMPYVISQN